MGFNNGKSLYAMKGGDVRSKCGSAIIPETRVCFLANLRNMIQKKRIYAEHDIEKNNYAEHDTEKQIYFYV